MHTKALTTFLCVAETGGFHAAARKLNVTQTAVSARIRQLEEETGKLLFTRGVGGTNLTEFGHQFRPYAEQITALWSFASTDLPEQGTTRVAMRLGAQLSIWDPLLVDLAIQFEEKVGKILLTLNYDHDLNMTEAVTTGTLDAALVHEKPNDPRVAIHDLAPERLVLIETPDPRMPVFVNLELGELYRSHVRAALRHPQDQTIFLGNCLMALRYVLKRGGKGYFPHYLVADHLASGAMNMVEGAEDLYLPLCLVTRRDSRQTSSLQDILSCLSDLRRPTQAEGTAAT